MAGETDQRWLDARRRLQAKLLGVLDRHSGDEQTVRAVAEAVQQLDELERLHLAGRPGGAGGGGRYGLARSYAIRAREGEDGPWLVETREGSRQPFRVSREIYEQAAEALAKFDEPVTFDQLMRKLEAVHGGRMPEYLLRICVRFWQDKDHKLIQRRACRYSPVPPLTAATFQKHAVRQWRQMEKTGSAALQG